MMMLDFQNADFVIYDLSKFTCMMYSLVFTCKMYVIASFYGFERALYMRS